MTLSPHPPPGTAYIALPSKGVLGVRPHAACRALLTCLLALSASVPAAGQTSQDLESARKHFRAAREFEQAKQWEDARRELKAAIAIKETPGLRYHLAYCDEQLADYSDSLAGYERAQELLDEGQKAADVAKLIGPAIARVSALVGSLTLVLPAEPIQDLLLDGNKIDASAAAPLRLTPGAHRLEAKASGFRPFIHEFVVRAGQAQSVQVTMVPVREGKPEAAPVTQTPAPSDTRPDSSSSKPYVLIAEGVLTAVGIGVGVAFTLQASNAGDEADKAAADATRRDPARACDNPDPAIQDSCSQYLDFKNQQSDARTLSTIGFVTAGVGAASLIATLLLWPSQAPSADAARRSPTLGFRAAPARGGAWLGLHGAF